MAVWAIADLHLCFGVPEKTMEVFGAAWSDYATKLKANWLNLIHTDDLVLIAGDISWATRLEDARKDLDWIETLPGTKVMIRGNHDYWWSSLSKVKKILPPSMHVIQNDAFQWKEYSIGGARLWDTEEYNFNDLMAFQNRSPSLTKESKSPKQMQEQERIFLRELMRLELSLKSLDQKALKRIVMTHYPPIGWKLAPSRVSVLLEKYHVECCVFGHLHNLLSERPLFGTARGVSYFLTSSDYLDFKPFKIN